MRKAVGIPIPKKKGVGRKRNAAAVLDEITAYRIGGFYRSDLEAARMNVERYYKRKFTDADEFNLKVDALRKRIYARAVELLTLTKPI